ncbi:ring-cleaving dioxygenase [Salisediminibacterium beveridgei]|uniref:Glyoxalase family protein n=1 Tax=Salisediminibacterium beveridgei TaxID=632773 RepID=A0A1D7QY61_9BACI|nr:ring-cleaving dioxygenase [Salisediminibacterium beveridgei]AOM83939.1 Glyoxalase family protein [Salisediminibacterium beveridgei]
MTKQTQGIHHISTIVGHPQENADFYAGVLGLRLVKKTVNFDDPGTYHLYFGNESGDPGTIITFFPWPKAHQGRIGGGQAGATTYIIPEGSLMKWQERLEEHGIAWARSERFGETYLRFNDPHGLKLELVEREAERVKNHLQGKLGEDMAIIGFGGAVLYSTSPEDTVNALENTMGLKRIGQENDLIRFKAPGTIGNLIDVRTAAMPRGRMGVGTVHHIAWRAVDDTDQLDWKQYVEGHGYKVTPVRDRNYFNAIYFREKGEILFEIATDSPGFAIDESKDKMGSELKLPPQFESQRETIEQTLPNFNL